MTRRRQLDSTPNLFGEVPEPPVAPTRPKKKAREAAAPERAPLIANRFAQVALNRPVDCEFTYGVPVEMEEVIAVGSGGVGGAGLGQGRQQLGYMPEGHSDFILAGVGEELGFVGITAILLLLGIVVWRGTLAASRSRDSFGCYLAFGLTLAIGIQALFNTGVVLGVIPAKGITLPLVSYGGTSLVVTMYAIGLILSVARAAPPRGRKRALVNHVGARKRRQRAVITCA